MGKGVKTPAARHDDWSSIPRTPMSVNGIHKPKDTSKQRYYYKINKEHMIDFSVKFILIIQTQRISS